MKGSSAVILSIFIVIMVIGAGCTQPDTTSGPGATSAPPAAALPLGTIALTAADAPANFMMVESREKTSGEIGTLAKDLGWQSGYIVIFSSQPGIVGQTVIVQNIVTYPAATIPKVMEISKTYEMADKELVITSLPSPGIGDSSIAFSGKAGAQASAGQGGDILVQGTYGGSTKQDMIEIMFTKGSTMEVLRMSGPGTDYATLHRLAETASAKQP